MAEVDTAVMSDMMSDMKTFTSRDLSRSAAAVLAASEVDGVAKIKTRDGRVFEVRMVPPEAPRRSKHGAQTLLDELIKLKKQHGSPRVTKEQWDEIECSMTERSTETVL